MTVHRTYPARVVVADDSAVFRQALTRFLSTRPEIQVVAQATNGQEALQLVEAMAPDLLILDIQMPEMDGIQVLQQLQTMKTHVQTVVLSAHNDGYEELALASGATAFVSKGNAPLLLNTVLELLKQPS